jgi:hypothetical protein
LTCTPSRSDLRLPNDVFRFSCCLRLALPPLNLTPAWKLKLFCPDCNESLLDDPFHRIHCVHESAIGRRAQHDRVNTLFASFAKSCGHGVTVEPGNFIDPTTKKRPDGFLRLDDGSHIIYDVRGFDPLAKSYINVDAEKIAERAADLKINKYQVRGVVEYPNLEMKPFIYDTLAGLTPPAVKLIKRVANTGRLSSAREPSMFIHNAIASISVAIQVDNHAMVMKSFQQARP